MDKMTVQELRQLLFAINNQEMTVRELRKKLFDMNDQNLEIDKKTFENM